MTHFEAEYEEELTNKYKSSLKYSTNIKIVSFIGSEKKSRNIATSLHQSVFETFIRSIRHFNRMTSMFCMMDSFHWAVV